MGALYGLTAFVFAILPIVIFALIVVTLTRRVNQGGQSGDGKRRRGKISSPMDPASRTIRRTEERMDALDAWHQGEDCTFSYSTRDPSFSFNGRQVVDELAELRRKNEAHERHLLERVHRD